MNVFLETRQRLRKEKQFAAADALRDRLASLGIEINDTPEGSTWKRK
jgi:cysteinyl-tRNA synthetase